MLYHKQRTSARTRFLLIGEHVVIGGGRVAPRHVADHARVGIHPASGLAALARRLDLAPSALRVDGDPLGTLGAQAMPVWLVEVTTIDPPFAAAATLGGQFVALLEARQLDHDQRELLAVAYTRILG